MPRFNAAAFIIFTGAPLVMAGASTNRFANIGTVTQDDVESSFLAELVEQLKPGPKHDRLHRIEEEIRPMFAALPKDDDGRLGHSIVRYALHRLFVNRHGWFIKGLEPGAKNDDPSKPANSLMDWVPSYLQEMMERKSGTHGFDIKELAAFVATLEDIIHTESVDRLKETYKMVGLDHKDQIEEEASYQVMDNYLMVYLRQGNVSVSSADEAVKRLEIFKKRYPDWQLAEDWIRELQKKIPTKNGKVLDFEETSKLAEDIGTEFADFNYKECLDVKQTLLGMEDRRQGRVLLSVFYKKGLVSHWAFTEKIDYLRALGALDESEPDKPAVIIPNYIASRPQCLEASSYYAVCCRNECEDLMNSLEDKIKEPHASTARLTEVVQTLTTHTVTEPRALSPTLIGRLESVADANGGRVPLHGRLFAQWLHHAFPRECPFPHQAGTINPQTADEWAQQTGQDTQASEEEMTCHVNGPCAGGATTAVSADTPAMELPWSEVEELLGDARASVQKPASAPALPAAGSWTAFNRFMRTTCLSGAAFGMTVVSEFNMPNVVDDPSAKKHEHRVGRWATVGLFFMPLLVVSADFFLFGQSSGNEFLLCGLCWSVAALVVFRLREQDKAMSLPV